MSLKKNSRISSKVSSLLLIFGCCGRSELFAAETEEGKAPAVTTQITPEPLMGAAERPLWLLLIWSEVRSELFSLPKPGPLTHTLKPGIIQKCASHNNTAAPLHLSSAVAIRNALLESREDATKT